MTIENRKARLHFLKRMMDDYSEQFQAIGGKIGELQREIIDIRYRYDTSLDTIDGLGHSLNCWEKALDRHFVEYSILRDNLLNLQYQIKEHKENNQ